MILDISSLCTWLEAQQMLGRAEPYRARLHIFSIIYDVSGNSCSWVNGQVEACYRCGSDNYSILNAGCLVINLQYY